MSIVLKIGLTLIVLILVSIIIILAYHDFFISQKVIEKEMGPYTIATKRFVGAYSKVGPTMIEVDTFLRNLGIKSTHGVGLYYGDPSKQKESELKSDVGNIINNVDTVTLQKIKEKLDVRNINKQKAIVVEYPIKSPLSYMLGPIKAYPAITAYWRKKGYPEAVKGSFGMELYDIPRKTTYYVMYIPK